MTRRFTPRRDILPEAQRRLWPHLASAARLGFVLYGGTAVALRQGHRFSIDFDFFSGRPLDRTAMAAALPFTITSTVLQETTDTLTVLTGDPAIGEVKVSFFGLPGFGRVAPPDRTDDDVLLVASQDDLLATKLKVILQRAEAKDYRDIAALLRAGADLAYGLGSARALFGRNFQPAESLKALVYFGDGDLATLPPPDRMLLRAKATAVAGLPDVRLAAATPD